MLGFFYSNFDPPKQNPTYRNIYIQNLNKKNLSSPSKNFYNNIKRKDMNDLREFDFVIFHTPMNEQEQKEVYLVVDELADDEDRRSLEVMEIHQRLSIPCINTFKKSDFKLYYRPIGSELELLKKAKKLKPTI